MRTAVPKLLYPSTAAPNTTIFTGPTAYKTLNSKFRYNPALSLSGQAFPETLASQPQPTYQLSSQANSFCQVESNSTLSQRTDIDGKHNDSDEDEINISHHFVRSHGRILRSWKTSFQKNISYTKVTLNRSEQDCPATTTVSIGYHNSDKKHIQHFPNQQGAKNTLNDLSKSKPSFQPVKRHRPFTVLLLVHNAGESDNERQSGFFASPSQRKKWPELKAFVET